MKQIEHLELWRWEKLEAERESAEQKAEEEREEREWAEQQALMKEARAEYDAQKKKNRCDDCGQPCDSWLCQDCCPHDEHDHGYCLECGKDIMDDIVGGAELARDAREDR